tara:strand:- start:259 stop:843 length:585 start_codon:yes stop_codon:yes gene_type:complete
MIIIPTENQLLLIFVLYIVGSIPFSIIFARLFNLSDPRTFGSKNPGATNMLRTGNKLAAILTLIGDIAKGFLPIFLLKKTELMVDEIYLLAFFIYLGHIFSVFMRLKGGKAVATSIGVVLGIDYLIAILLILTWIIVYLISRISGLSAITAFVLLPSFFYFFSNYDHLASISIFNTLLILITHRSNIVGLLSKN